jgi:hypothetical protein
MAELAILTAVASLAAGAISAAGAIHQGKVQKSIDESNQAAQLAAADRARAIGSLRAEDETRKGEHVMGTARARLAASGGGGIGTETGDEIVSALGGKIQTGAERDVWMGEQAGRHSEFESGVSGAMAGTRMTSAYLNGGTALLGGVSSALSGRKKATDTSAGYDFIYADS